MSQRTALLVSAALTAIVLVAGVGLTVRLMNAPVEATVTGDASDADVPSEADLDRERDYRAVIDRLQEANSALATSYERIAGLLDDVEQLRAQNAQLREREALYQERLAEANSRLQRQGQEAVAVPRTAQASSDDPPLASTVTSVQAPSRSSAPPQVAAVPAPSSRVASKQRDRDDVNRRPDGRDARTGRKSDHERD
jgi:hypothetical protein